MRYSFLFAMTCCLISSSSPTHSENYSTGFDVRSFQQNLAFITLFCILVVVCGLCVVMENNNALSSFGLNYYGHDEVTGYWNVHLVFHFVFRSLNEEYLYDFARTQNITFLLLNIDLASALNIYSRHSTAFCDEYCCMLHTFHRLLYV